MMMNLMDKLKDGKIITVFEFHKKTKNMVQFRETDRFDDDKAIRVLYIKLKLMEQLGMPKFVRVEVTPISRSEAKEWMLRESK